MSTNQKKLTEQEVNSVRPKWNALTPDQKAAYNNDIELFAYSILSVPGIRMKNSIPQR